MILKNTPRSTTGFSLIEMLLVLTIISAIIVGTFVFYPRVRDSSASREEAGHITSLLTEIRQLYPNGNYGELVTNDLVGGTSLPQDYYVAPSDPLNSYSGAVLSNRWGAAIEVYPVQSDGTRLAPGPGTNASMFAIRYWGLTAPVCRYMASHLIRSSHALLIDDGAVDGPLLVARNTYEGIDDDPAALAQGCREVDGQRPRLIVISH